MDRKLRSGLFGVATVFNARRPFIRNRALTVPSFALGWIGTEAAQLWLVRHGLSTARLLTKGRARSRQEHLALAAHAAAAAGFAGLIVEGRRTGEEIEPVLAPFLSPETIAARPQSVHIGEYIPVLMGQRNRTINRNISYGKHGWRNKMDVVLPRAESTGPRPALLQIHGGGWILGNKQQQGLALLNHMAKQGWIGFNMNYRLAPKTKFPEQLIDCKSAVAWIREHADELGVDPDFIAVTGGSAGGYLTAMMALTANDPEFQPGFESSDTTVQAAVPFYGVYDLLDRNHAMAPGFDHFLQTLVVGSKMTSDEARWTRFSPIDRVHPDAPPMMILHGTVDTLVPVEQARPFAQAMKQTSDHAVLYAELAGANHAFDIFPSPRSVRTVEYVERFLDGVRRGEIK